MSKSNELSFLNPITFKKVIENKFDNNSYGAMLFIAVVIGSKADQLVTDLYFHATLTQSFSFIGAAASSIFLKP